MSDEKKPSAEELARREQWFENYVRDLSANSVVQSGEAGVQLACLGLIRSGGQVDYAVATGAREAFSYPAGLT